MKDSRRFARLIPVAAIRFAIDTDPALAQLEGCYPVDFIEVRGVRSGQEIRADGLENLLRDHLSIRSDGVCSEEDRLILQVIDRDGDVVGRWASEPLGTMCPRQGPCALSGEKLIPGRSLFRGDLFGGEHTFIAGRVETGSARGGVPSECQDATHAIVVGVGSDDSRFARGAPLLDICLHWRP